MVCALLENPGLLWKCLCGIPQVVKVLDSVFSLGFLHLACPWMFSLCETRERTSAVYHWWSLQPLHLQLDFPSRAGIFFLQQKHSMVSTCHLFVSRETERWFGGSRGFPWKTTRIRTIRAQILSFFLSLSEYIVNCHTKVVISLARIFRCVILQSVCAKKKHEYKGQTHTGTAAAAGADCCQPCPAWPTLNVSAIGEGLFQPVKEKPPSMWLLLSWKK